VRSLHGARAAWSATCTQGRRALAVGRAEVLALRTIRGHAGAVLKPAGLEAALRDEAALPFAELREAAREVLPLDLLDAVGKCQPLLPVAAVPDAPAPGAGPACLTGGETRVAGAFAAQYSRRGAVADRWQFDPGAHGSPSPYSQAPHMSTPTTWSMGPRSSSQTLQTPGQSLDSQHALSSVE